MDDQANRVKESRQARFILKFLVAPLAIATAIAFIANWKTEASARKTGMTAGEVKALADTLGIAIPAQSAGRVRMDIEGSGAIIAVTFTCHDADHIVPESWPCQNRTVDVNTLGLRDPVQPWDTDPTDKYFDFQNTHDPWRCEVAVRRRNGCFEVRVHWDGSGSQLPTGLVEAIRSSPYELEHTLRYSTYERYWELQ